MDTQDRSTDRRQADVTPVIERRDPPPAEPFVPRWLKWTRENDARGKSLDGRAA
jgi:hypothetical protein